MAIDGAGFSPMKSLGEVLVESFGLTQENIEQALLMQKEKGGRLGEILVQQKVLSPIDLMEARSVQCGLELLRELPPNPDPFFTSKVPIQYLKKFKMILLRLGYKILVGYKNFILWDQQYSIPLIKA